jgi:histidinol phosphatase-like enzyme
MKTNWKKIVFLDIDGVVNHEIWYVMTEGKSGHFDPEAIALLNQLESIGAEVVVTSSWGNDGVEQLKNVGLKLPILGCTKKLHYQFDWACRGNEIDYWLTQNFGGIGTSFGRSYRNDDYEYVIFDDESDMLLGQKDNFIQTDEQTGITQEDIDKAIKILNREN